MPINIPDSLPASKVLESENIFVMTEKRAMSQDIRPLKILLLNLMPKKIETETQILRLLSNSPIQVDIELLQTASHQSKNTPSEHLLKFYKVFDDVKDQRFDGLIITGAPIETLDYPEVDYISELHEILDWATHNVFSTFNICWGAQAALHHYYGVPKHPLPGKMFGLFSHRVLEPRHTLMRGFDEIFWAPHSRHTEVRRADIEKCGELEILAESDEAGVYIAASKDGRRYFVTGHSEYDRETLANEYFRDVNKGMEIELPKNYFPGDNPDRPVPYIWRSHAYLLYANWLNFVVYQMTPYDLKDLDQL